MTRAHHLWTDEELATACAAGSDMGALLEWAFRQRRNVDAATTARVKDLAAGDDPVLAARARVVLPVVSRAFDLHAPDLSDEGLGSAMWRLRALVVHMDDALNRLQLTEADHWAALLEHQTSQRVEPLPLEEQAMLANLRGRLSYRRRDLVAALDFFAAAASGYREAGRADREAIDLINLGNVLSDLGDVGGALASYTHALQLVGDSATSRFATALAHGNIGEVYHRMGEQDKARQYVRSALEVVRHDDVPSLVIHALVLLAQIEHEAGQLEAMERLVLRAEARLQDAGAWAGMLHEQVTDLRALLLAARGHAQAGVSLLEGLAALADPMARAHRADALSGLLEQLERHAEVIQVLEPELAALRDIEAIGGRAATDRLARAFQAQGRHAEALDTLRQHLAWTENRHRQLATVKTGGRAAELDARAADSRERAAKEQARMMQQQLMRAQRLEATGQLASGIAHDFNNLLTVVLGEAESIIESGEASEDIQKSAVVIASVAERGGEVVRRLLTFARQTPAELRPVELNAFLGDLVPMLQTAVGRSVQLRWVTHARPTWVRADVGLLEQMVLNLSLNARDAMKGGGTVTVTVDAAPGLGILRVADTGSGIPAHVLPRIFDPFFTTKDKEGGTGLGLAMVFGGAEQLGGTVRVSSTEGQGSEFSLELDQVPSLPSAGRP